MDIIPQLLIKSTGEKNMYNHGLVFGRFNIIHNGHIDLLNIAQSNCNHFDIVICSKNSDPINVGLRDYWHEGEDEQELIDLYKQAGYDCLVIWEKDMKNIKAVMKRLSDFLRKK
jgi:cytidyltransferase-like protein